MENRIEIDIPPLVFSALNLDATEKDRNAESIGYRRRGKNAIVIYEGTETAIKTLVRDVQDILYIGGIEWDKPSQMRAALKKFLDKNKELLK